MAALLGSFLALFDLHAFPDCAFATIYQLVGLDPLMKIRDRSGQQIPIALEGEPVWDVIA